MFHSQMGQFIPQINAPFSLLRMPLFFFLSGVFFSATLKPKLFFSKKSEALLKPYFSVLLLLLLISYLLNQDQLTDQFYGILYGNGDTIQWVPMWFLSHLFALYCFSYLLFRYTGFNRYTPAVKWTYLFITLSLGTLSIGVFWQLKLSVLGRSFVLPGLPFSMDIMLVTSVYLIAGNLLKEKTIHFTPDTRLFTFALIIYLCIAYYTEAHIDLNQRVYSNPAVATLGAIGGIYIVMCLSFLISRHKTIKQIFIILGSSSLYILIFHNYIDGLTYSIFGEYVADDHRFLLSMMTFLLSITLPLAIKWAVNNNSVLALFFLPCKSNTLLQRIAMYAAKK